MFLDATTKKLQIILGGAVTTNELPWHVAYGEVAADNSTSAPKGSHGLTTGGTAVDVIAAPAGGLVRELLHLTIQNADTAAATVTVRLDDGGTPRVSVQAALAVGDQLVYDIAAGWRTLNSAGAVKGTSTATPHDLLDGTVNADTLAGTVVRGDIIRGNSTPKWARLALGAAHRFLQSDGTDCAWVALSGDATLAAGVITIANNAVTYAKMQDVSATARIIGRKTAAAGDAEECTLSEVLDFIGSAAQGDILYRDSAAWARLGAGTNGFVLKTQGAAANPVWAASSGGTWTRLATATASASAVIDFTLSSAYAAYRLVFSHVVPVTDNVSLWVRTSTDGGSTFSAGASDYRYSTAIEAEGGGLTSTSSTGAAQLVVNNSLGNASNEQSSGEIVLFNPAAAKYGMLTWTMVGVDTAGLSRFATGGGLRLTAADIDAVRVMYSSGNISSGQFDLFGLAN